MTPWVIPYVDQGLDFWQEVHRRFADHVHEVYFPVLGRRLASGRPWQPESQVHDFLRHALLAKSVLVNPIVLPRPVEIIAPVVLSLLQELAGEYGLQRVTVTSLALARAIHDTLPDWHVTASVLVGIATPAQAWQAQAAAGRLDAITVDNRLVRDLPGLRQMRAAFPGELRMIVNEGCLPGCLFRTQHFYEMGYGDDWPQSLCQPLLDEHPWLRLTGAWVLPRHLSHFDGLCDTFKLAGRVTLRDPQRYLAVLEAYVHRLPISPGDIGGGPASVIEPLDLPDEWFEFVLHCDKRCDRCSVCRDAYAHADHRKERG
jgi:hypothetical protein